MGDFYCWPDEDNSFVGNLRHTKLQPLSAKSHKTRFTVKRSKCNGPLLVLDVEGGEVLLQVLLDQIVGGLFGLTEPSDDERKRISQRLRLLSSFLKHHPYTDMTITTKHISVS